MNDREGERGREGGGGGGRLELDIAETDKTCLQGVDDTHTQISLDSKIIRRHFHKGVESTGDWRVQGTEGEYWGLKESTGD